MAPKLLSAVRSRRWSACRHRPGANASTSLRHWKVERTSFLRGNAGYLAQQYCASHTSNGLQPVLPFQYAADRFGSWTMNEHTHHHAHAAHDHALTNAASRMVKD